jgi:hypothetical protein
MRKDFMMIDTIQTDPFISPYDLQNYLRIGRESLRTLVRDGKIPAYDVFLTNKIKGWHRSTLVQACLMPACHPVILNERSSK